MQLSSESKNQKYKFWNKDKKLREETWDETETLTGVHVQPNITRTEKKEQDALNLIFKKVNHINKCIEKMREDISVLKNCQILVQQSPRTNPGMRDKVQDLMAAIKSNAANIRADLQDFDKLKDNSENAVNKVIETQQCLMKKAFSDVMDEYQQSLLLHQKICEDILKKQLTIVIQMVIRSVKCVPADKEVTQEELGAILEADDIAIFVDNYMRDTLEAKMRLQDAQDLHKEITAIEKEIKIMNEMFTDLSLHVIRQGEVVDKIEYHIIHGSEMTQKSTKRIGKAHKMMKKIRKRKMWLIIIVVSIVFILLFIAIVF